MSRDDAAGVKWMSRLPCSVVVQVGDEPAQALTEWLQQQTTDRVDVSAVVGTEQRLSCRLLAVRCPEEVRQRRLRKLEARARRKGYRVSERQRRRCGWTVLVTNLAAAALTIDEAWVLYRVRWQIETCQADYPSSRRWVGTGRIGYHRRDGVARTGRVVPATPGRLHRRSRMPDPTRRPAPPRA